MSLYDALLCRHDHMGYHNFVELYTLKCLYESKVDSSTTFQNNEFLLSNSSPTLEDTDMNICEGKLLITECFDALSKMSIVAIFIRDTSCIFTEV